MKTVVSTFLAFFFTVTLFAQNFVADEFIVEYVSGTTNTQQQAVRDLFGITSTTNIGDDIELWEDIAFPLSVTENGETTIIDDVEELLYYINIQEGEENSNTAIINNGNLQLLFQLEQDGAFNEDGTFVPLPYCDEVHNDRLFCPAPESINPPGQVKILIIDQLVSGSGIEIIPLASGPLNLGGTHGNKVYSVISNILSQTEVQNVEYISAPVFNSNGTATVTALIEVMNYVKDNFLSNSWTADDLVIINFSANLVFPDNVNINEVASILSLTWYRLLNSTVQNVIAVSSAGNQELISGNIFPGSMQFDNEISVAGTQDCFQNPWSGTNHDPNVFEIAAESENVLTSDGTNYFLSSGTSFAAPQVTAGIAQIFYYSRERLRPSAIKNVILDLAEQVPALMGTVQYGRVLNLGNYGASNETGGTIRKGVTTPLQTITPTSPLTLTTTPNPFTTTALVTIQLPEAADVTISMYNMIGQRVHEEYISNQQEMTELEWPTPTKLTRGTYLLRVQAGEAVEQMMMVKQ